MKISLKQEVSKEGTTALSITKVDAGKSGNQLEAGQIKSVTALKHICLALLIKTRKEASIWEGIKANWCSFVAETTGKMSTGICKS